ncbi:MAG TPA: DUF5996 family protein [Vicinamibacterales bacterium]|nr:DUF5996 family protein [Vicinamibacterales bacterium]
MAASPPLAPTLSSLEWPAFTSPAWPDTYATLHMWMQIVGKIRLKFAAPVNHWWGAALQLSARGITTAPMPYNGASFEMAFDFCAHELQIRTNDARVKTIKLAPKTVADFYAEIMQALAELGVSVTIWTMPVEVPSPIRFTSDTIHRSYDAAAAGIWWRAMAHSADVMNEFRARFIGKSSPVHFWWGSFDLAVTRFSGRRAPERAGADRVTTEAYSHEVISAGFWPGGGAMPEPAYYAYAAPEPDGFKTARVGPPAAFYSADFGEYLLKYEDVRTASSPREALLEFLQTTYEAGATLGQWNRKELER